MRTVEIDVYSEHELLNLGRLGLLSEDSVKDFILKIKEFGALTISFDIPAE